MRYFEYSVYQMWFYEVQHEMEMEEFWAACWEFPPTICSMEWQAPRFVRV